MEQLTLPRRDLCLVRAFEDLPPLLRGYAQGTNEAADIIRQTADGADLNLMWQEFQASTALLNRQRDPYVDLLTFPVSNPTERILVPVSEDFEQATEYGEPRGIRLGVPYIAGYDFAWYDLAIRYTWLFLAEAFSDQVRALNGEALEADNRLVFKRVMRTVFNNVNSSAFVNDQNVNVYRFYNADGFVPPTYKNTTFTGSHTHYITSGAATIDSGDMTAMEDHLYHHGYRLALGYRLIVMVNRQEGQVIRGFKTTKATPDPYDFIPLNAVGGGIILPASMGIVGRPDSGGTGAFLPNTIGTYGPWIVVEDDYIPAGYVFAFATAGERNLGNPVGIREHLRPELRGLRLVQGPNNDYPLTDSFYQHGLGTGVRHRGAGVVQQITAAGSYTIPPAYV